MLKPSALQKFKKSFEGQAGTAQLHTRRVRFLRMALPLTAVAIILVMFLWTDMDAVVEAVPREKIAPQMIGKNELLNPRFESQDEKKQPYTITATKAFQDNADLDHVLLDAPLADIALSSGGWLAIKALKGDYFQKAGILKLKDDVKLYHDDGYELLATQAEININEQTAEIVTPIKGQGPVGKIEAVGLKAYGAEGRLVFLGPAKLILNKSFDLAP